MGGSGGCGRFVKFSLFVTNLVVFIAGAIVFGLAIWTLVDKSFINELMGTNMFSGVVYVLIFMSLVVLFLSFLGCMGAAKEIKCMLLTYFTIIFLVFVVVLIGGILGYVFREKVTHTMRQEMHSSLKFYGNRRPVTQSWDSTQERLKCCGVDSYRDWQLYGRIPESCCQETYGGQKKPCIDNPNPQTIYMNGCLHITTDYVREHASIIAGCSIALAVLMVFAMIFSCSLFRMIK
uniref:Tetraspanin n=1 Tax=Culicoides sonorensis TaxID=179676 RepID=A0A336MEI8_CULSO